MYKVVVVGGKLRGKEFTLSNGDNIFGRDGACTFQIDVDGVSKRHMNITVADDTPYVQDLGSSNGTFVNGKIVKRATLKAGDKISLPDIIFQLIKIQEKKKIIKKAVVKQAVEEADFTKPPAPPQNLAGKIIYLFKYKLMPFLYGINQEYEWRVLFAIVLSIFVLTTITLTIFPVLDDSKRILLREVALRGQHFAEEIGRINARALEQKNIDSVDTNFMESEEGVESYELYDLEGRIVRPIARLNEYINDPFSIKAKEWVTTGINRDSNTLVQLLDNGQIGIGHKVMAFNSKMGSSEAVGIIAIRFKPKSLTIEATKNSKAFLESLIISAIVAIIFFGIVYFMTIRHLEELKHEIEEVLKGKKRAIEGSLLMEEMNALKTIINGALQRLREFQSVGKDETVQEEEAGPYIESLKYFYACVAGPAMVLDNQKNLQAINPAAEDITGIREAASVGVSLLDLTREQGFAATLIELCDGSANNGGVGQQGKYELQGRPYKLHVVAMIGKDKFAKGFLVSMIKDE